MIVTYEIKTNPKPRKPLTPEEIAAIEARAPRDEDIIYDEDCPEMTEEQREQFAKMRQEREEAQKQYDAELQQIMTPEQYKAYQADQEEMRRNFGRRGQGGQRGGRGNRGNRENAQ